MLNFAEKVLSARIGRTHLFSVGQAGYIIKSKNGQLLAIDLYLSNCVERLEGHKGFKRLLPQILSASDLQFDAIICTHPHLDHFDVDAIPEMLSNGTTKLFCSVNCSELVKQTMLDYHKKQIYYVAPNDYVDCGDFHIKFMPCDHGKSAKDAVGVLVTVDDKIIYEVGDSCLRMDRVKDLPEGINVLIAPINGLNGNMNGEECSELAAALQPKLTVPCHYGMFASHGGD